MLDLTKEKRKECLVFFCDYLRFRSTRAAAIATMIMTAMPTARYVVCGDALVGSGAVVAEGEADCVGMLVWVGVEVGGTAGETEAGVDAART